MPAPDPGSPFPSCCGYIGGGQSGEQGRGARGAPASAASPRASPAGLPLSLRRAAPGSAGRFPKPAAAPGGCCLLLVLLCTTPGCPAAKCACFALYCFWFLILIFFFCWLSFLQRAVSPAVLLPSVLLGRALGVFNPIGVYGKIPGQSGSEGPSGFFLTAAVDTGPEMGLQHLINAHPHQCKPR